MRTIGIFYGVDGKKLQRQLTRNYLSDLKIWEQKGTCQTMAHSVPARISAVSVIDETGTVKGSSYTIITK